MGIDGPTFVPKRDQFLLIQVKVCLNKLAFSSFLSQFYELDFFDKISNKKSTFVLVSGFFGCCIFTVLFKYYLKGRFSTKKAPKLQKSPYFMLNYANLWENGFFGKLMWTRVATE